MNFIPELTIFAMILLSITGMQITEIPNQCVIIQDKESINVDFHTPSFLTNADKAQCQVHKADLRSMLTKVLEQQGEILERIKRLEKREEERETKKDEQIYVPPSVRIAVRDGYSDGVRRGFSWTFDKKNHRESENEEMSTHIIKFVKGWNANVQEKVIQYQGMLRCGQTNVFIKPECVCSFYNVYEASLYHGYSSCPSGNATDIVTELKCPDCKKYSLNNNGPCINGGKLTCRGEEVAPEITCQCPENYGGMFCENKIENVTRVCDMISITSTNGLPNCAVTGRDCIAYSRNKKYAYRCNETNTSQDRQGLPLCIDTENLTVRPTMSMGTVSVQTAIQAAEASHLTSGSRSIHCLFILEWCWIFYFYYTTSEL